MHLGTEVDRRLLALLLQFSSFMMINRLLKAFSGFKLLIFILCLTILGTANAVTLNENIKGLLARKESATGPNCWNAALYTVGAYPYVLNTTDLHAKSIFKKSCTPVNTTIENAPAGSLIRYQSRAEDADTKEEIHAFVKIGADKFFQKESTSDDYQVVSLDEVNEDYGESYCQLRGCTWSYQVLSCQPITYSIPKEYDQLFSLLSDAVKSPQAFTKNQKPMLSLMSQILANSNLVNKAIKDTETFLFLIDFQGTLGVRFGFDNQKFEVSDSFLKSAHHFIAVHFYTLLKQSAPTKAILREIYDFASDAKFTLADPDQFAELLFQRMKEKEIPQDMSPLVTRLKFYTNESISYKNAGSYVAQAFQQIELTKDMNVKFALLDFLHYSATPYPNKDQELQKLSNEVQIMTNGYNH